MNPTLTRALFVCDWNQIQYDFRYDVSFIP